MALLPQKIRIHFLPSLLLVGLLVTLVAITSINHQHYEVLAFTPLVNHHHQSSSSTSSSFIGGGATSTTASTAFENRFLLHDRKKTSSKLVAFSANNLQDEEKVAITSTSTSTAAAPSTGLVGDDAGYFSFEEQKLDEWIQFTVATSFVLALVSYVWFLPFGLHWGDEFLCIVQSATGTKDPAMTAFSMLCVFAFFHSGLAGLRPYAENVIIGGARTWRVIFALVSLPLALSCIAYFINHAHEGIQLWDATHVPGIHTFLWVTNFVSFLFLYPSTFNLLEIAAIQKPQLHLYETGIMRITRHPQAIGQFMWCFAHTVWLGTTTAIAASAVLCAHHAFSVYHGDRRLQQKHGEAFDYIKSKTSIIPFAAIIEGRQQLPSDYWKEFLRGPYFLVVGGTIAAYFAHPYMQAGAALLDW